MANYGLMVVRNVSTINIGDYVQALAAKQFLPHVDELIERELLKSYSGNTTKMIMNGWFMHNTGQWPPSDRIDPLFIAFHVNVLAKEKMLNEEGIAYLKMHEPIGCRDYATVDYLKAKGIKAYFSGCLTLTLGQTYKYEGERSGIYIVDPPVEIDTRLKRIRALVWGISHYKQVKTVYKKITYIASNYSRFLWASSFTKCYFSVLCDDLFNKAEFITQQDSLYNKLGDNNNLLNEADRLLKLYSKAKLIITSRIHCALPSLSMETPVLYIYDDNQIKASSCRMKGLLELFNVIHFSKGKLYYEDEEKQVKINLNCIPKNKDTWKEYAGLLIEKCSKFVSFQTPQKIED